jgi:two-component system nitrogen regulation sensor histidine kinase NtrY
MSKAGGKSHSLERFVLKMLTLQFVIIALLVVLGLYNSTVSALVATTCGVVVFIGLLLWLNYCYKKIISPLEEMSISTEAIHLEDYAMTSVKPYQQGVVAQLHDDISMIGADLQQRKDSYNLDIYLVYRLIEQLEMPVMVIDAKLCLTHANAAFEQWYGQPWQSVRGSKANRLGLCLEPDLEQTDTRQWHFVDKQIHEGWQIKASRFIDANDDYQLLMLNNIEQTVRDTQQQAWHQIVRVLSHEIRNSLTPIISLAESLLAMDEVGERPKQALQVIYDRSDSLQTFINSYAANTQSIVLDLSQFSAKTLINNIAGLFTHLDLQLDVPEIILVADKVLLEQVLINLIQNADDSIKQKQQNLTEQTPASIYIGVEQSGGKLLLSIEDNGLGITNPDNLFVPFYTTKENGQGIGLFFCRKIIEQHKGRLTLKSRSEGGARAVIELPEG